MENEEHTPDLAAAEEERKRLVQGLLFAVVFSVLLIGFFHLLAFLFS